VGALVEQDATPLALPRGPPASAGVIDLGSEPVGDDPAHPHQLTQLALADELLHLEVPRLGPELEHGGKDLLRVARVRRDQPLGIGLVDGNRLFDHDVEAGLERGNPERRVLVVRRGDEDGVHGARLDELFPVLEGAEAFGGPRFERGQGVGHGGELRAGDLARRR